MTEQQRTEQNERAQTVATTILEQLGGKEFLTMTGAHVGFGHDDVRGQAYLQIQLSINTHTKDRPNRVRVLYDAGLDLYDMECLRVNHHSFPLSNRNVMEGLDVDQMRETFQEKTGLRLTLTRMG